MENLTLRLLSNQIGFYYSKDTTPNYETFESVTIPEGIFAFAFTENGTEELKAGTYKFSDLEKKGFFGKILSNSTKCPIAIVKKAIFKLNFDFSEIELKNSHCDLIIEALCKISDGKSFYENFLANDNLCDAKTVSQNLSQIVKNEISNLIYEKSLEEIANDKNISSAVLSKIQEKLKNIYPFIDFVEISNFEVKNENLSELKKSTESVDFLSKQNELEKKEKELEYEKFKTQSDLDKKYKETELENLKNQNEIEKKQKEVELETFKANSALEQQKKEREFENFKNSNEIDQKYKTIQQENKLSEIERNKTIEKTNLENKDELEKLALNKKIENQKIQDSYNDERLKQQIENDKAEMAAQMELMEQALKLRNARKDSDLEREMKFQQMQNQFELEKIKLQNEAIKLQNDEKIHSMEAESKSNEEKMQMMENQKNEMKEIVSEQLKTISSKNEW